MSLYTVVSADFTKNSDPLALSVLQIVFSAVIGWVRAVQLEKFQKQLNAGEISVEKTLKAMDAEDEAVAQAQTAAKAEEVQ